MLYINGSSTTFAYNAAGNLITEVKNGTTRTYSYNDHQRLTSVTEGGTTLGQYTYDAMGRRTKKVAGGNTTLYVYDQSGLLIAEYNGDGVWEKDYVYLNGQPLAMIVAGTPEAVYYYHNDHLGTPQMMTDSTGAVVWAATYEPFGKATITVQQITNNLRYPGQYSDSETGLHYNWHRDYNHEIGRYIESDPIGLGWGVNLYGYVLNNPILYKDQFGLYVEVGVRDFYPHKVPYARHCFVRFNGNNNDTLSFSNKGVRPDPNPAGGTYSKTTGNGCVDDCVRNEMKKCQGSDYDFFAYNCCMCVSNSLKACGLKKEGPWPNSPADATKPPYAPRKPMPPGMLLMPLGPTM